MTDGLNSQTNSPALVANNPVLLATADPFEKPITRIQN